MTVMDGIAANTDMNQTSASQPRQSTEQSSPSTGPPPGPAVPKQTKSELSAFPVDQSQVQSKAESSATPWQTDGMPPAPVPANSSVATESCSTSTTVPSTNDRDGSSLGSSSDTPQSAKSANSNESEENSSPPDGQTSEPDGAEADTPPGQPGTQGTSGSTNTQTSGNVELPTDDRSRWRKTVMDEVSKIFKIPKGTDKALLGAYME